MKFKATYREGIQITDLKPGDVIYIQKTYSGMMYHLECRFIEFKGGIVRAEVVSSDVSWSHKEPTFPTGMGKGTIITARKKKCFLWGKGKDDKWECCHWF